MVEIHQWSSLKSGRIELIKWPHVCKSFHVVYSDRVPYVILYHVPAPYIDVEALVEDPNESERPPYKVKKNIVKILNDRGEMANVFQAFFSLQWFGSW